MPGEKTVDLDPADPGARPRPRPFHLGVRALIPMAEQANNAFTAETWGRGG